MFSRNVTAFLILLKKTVCPIDTHDEIVRETLMTRDGQVVNPQIRDRLARRPSLLIRERRWRISCCASTSATAGPSSACFCPRSGSTPGLLPECACAPRRAAWTTRRVGDRPRAVVAPSDTVAAGLLPGSHPDGIAEPDRRLADRTGRRQRRQRTVADSPAAIRPTAPNHAGIDRILKAVACNVIRPPGIGRR